MDKTIEIEKLIKILIEKQKEEEIDVTELSESIKKVCKFILQNNYQDIENQKDEITNQEISRWVTSVCTLKQSIEMVAKKVGIMGDYLPTIRFGVSWIEKGRPILIRLLSIESTPMKTIKEFIRMAKISRLELNSKIPDDTDDVEKLLTSDRDHFINIESIIHRVINNGKKNMIEQIDTLHSMGASLEVVQFEGFNKKTPLDCSVDIENLELFKYLINKGAGEKALHNNVNSFYKKQPQEIKATLRPFIKKLFLINAKIAWRLAFDEIFTTKPMATSGGNRLCKTATMNDRYITPTIYEMIFNNDGTPRNNNETTGGGRTRAKPIMESNGNFLIAKFQPQFPAMELITIKLTQNLFGEAAPFSELIKIDNYPIIVTQKVEGDILSDLISSTNPMDHNKLLNLDTSSMSKLFVSEMIINSAKGSFNDFIVSPILNQDITDETPQKYKLVRIENELSFVPSSPTPLATSALLFLGGKNSASVNSCLYLLNEMNDQVHQDVIDRFIRLDVTTFLTDWLFSVLNTHNTSLDLFDHNHDSIQHFNIENDKSYVGVSLPYGQIQTLYSKLNRIKNVLSKKRYSGNLTHWQLLEIIEPSIANIYRPFLPNYQPSQLPSQTFKIIKEKFIEFQNKCHTETLTSSFIYESRGIIVKTQKQLEIERKELLVLEKKIEEIKNLKKERDPITERNFKKLNERKKILEDSLTDEIQEFASIKEEVNQHEQLLEKIENESPIETILSALKKQATSPSPLSTTTGVQWETLIDKIDFSKANISSSSSDNHQTILDIIGSINDLRFYRIKNSNKLTIDSFKSSILQSINSIKKLYITNCQTLLTFQNSSLFGGKSPLVMTALTHFKVDQCKKLTTIKLDAPNLVSFSSTNCSELSEWDLKAPKLRKLKIQANKISTQTMSTFEKNFPLLSYLDISRIVAPSSKNVLTILELSHWKNLETLIADGVVSIEKISITNQLSKLSTLNFKGCSSLKEIQSNSITNKSSTSSSLSSSSVCPILQRLDLIDTLIPIERHSQLLHSLNNMKKVVICGLNDILSFSSSINLFDEIVNGVVVKSATRNKIEEVIHMDQLFQYNYSIEPTIPQRLFQQTNLLVLLMDSSNIHDSARLFEKYCHHLKITGDSQKINKPNKICLVYLAIGNGGITTQTDRDTNKSCKLFIKDFIKSDVCSNLEVHYIRIKGVNKKYKRAAIRETITLLLNTDSFSSVNNDGIKNHKAAQKGINQSYQIKIQKELESFYDNLISKDLTVVEILNQLEHSNYVEFANSLKNHVATIQLFNSLMRDSLSCFFRNLKKFYLIAKIEHNPINDFDDSTTSDNYSSYGSVSYKTGIKGTINYSTENNDNTEILTWLDDYFSKDVDTLFRCSTKDEPINLNFNSTKLLCRCIESGCIPAFYWYLSRNSKLLEQRFNEDESNFYFDSSPITSLVQYDSIDTIKWLNFNNYLNNKNNNNNNLNNNNNNNNNDNNNNNNNNNNFKSKILNAGLLKACQLGKIEIFKLLLTDEYGANYLHRDDDSLLSPIHMAAQGGHVEIMRLLFGRHSKDNANSSELMNSKDLQGNSPLHYAVQNCRTSVVEFLLNEKGDDINKQNISGETPIFQLLTEIEKDPTNNSLDALFHELKDFYNAKLEITVYKNPFDILKKYASIKEEIQH
ncbi:hypothetical protein ACTFIW_012666 [Dictyostelium discoideum]